MNGLIGGLKKARFYISVSAVYALTLLFVVSAFDIGIFHKKPKLVYATPITPISITNAVVVTAGQPAHVTVPRLGIDLPVDDGAYDAANKTWVLVSNNAYFALPSMMANDYQGTTLIYGHNNMSVFGKLKDIAPGDKVEVTTKNGLKFIYTFGSKTEVQPNDVSVFKYDGPPTLVIQTCSGAWNEIRSLYHFNFEKVIKL